MARHGFKIMISEAFCHVPSIILGLAMKPEDLKITPWYPTTMTFIFQVQESNLLKLSLYTLFPEPG
jgi:hypothetical protein